MSIQEIVEHLISEYKEARSQDISFDCRAMAGCYLDRFAGNIEVSLLAMQSQNSSNIPGSIESDACKILRKLKSNEDIDSMLSEAGKAQVATPQPATGFGGS